MSNDLRSLNNYHTLRAQARKTPLDLLEEMLAKLSAVVEEHREEQSSFRKVQEEKQVRLEAIRAQLLEDGIDPQELLNGFAPNQKAKSTRDARPAKYKYIDEHGNEKTWTGQGRTPKILALAIENGFSLLDYKI